MSLLIFAATRATGLTTCSVASESRNGQTVLTSRETMCKWGDLVPSDSQNRKRGRDVLLGRNKMHGVLGRNEANKGSTKKRKEKAMAMQC